MPEGDTIYRAARTLRAALVDRELTAVRTSVAQIRSLGPQRLVGQTVADVEPRGKHLLVWFAPSDLALHTHMRMTGSWHVYRAGERWRKPVHLAKIVLSAGDVTAVCFSAPVCELLSRGQVMRHPRLASLGPDALDDDVDLADARARLDARGDTAIGEALLDQRVLAGVGNVYKNEVLYLHGVDPWTPVHEVADADRDAVLHTAVRLLRRNAMSASSRRVTTSAGPSPDDAAPSDSGSASPYDVRRGTPAYYVYGRARRPCPRCATPIRAARQGADARLTYWCPRCQGPGPAGR